MAACLMEPVEIVGPDSDVKAEMKHLGKSRCSDVGRCRATIKARDAGEGSGEKMSGKRGPKRKRSLFALPVDEEEKAGLVCEYRKEVEALLKLYREEESLEFPRGKGKEGSECAKVGKGSEIAVFVEESEMPFSALVQNIFEKLGGGVTLASVKSSVLSIGVRVNYGQTGEDVDVLEDASESCLWRWEVRDLKLLPASLRKEVTDRRKRRKKISERILALSAAVAALGSTEMDQAQMVKVKDALGKADDEASIRAAAAEWKQKRGRKRISKDVPAEEEGSKETQQMEPDVEKARPCELRDSEQVEKEAVRLQRHAVKMEKEEKRLERERIEKREKIALQRQADMMGRFLKRGKGSVKPVQAEAAVSSTQYKEDLEQPSPCPATVSHVVEMDRQILDSGNLDVGDLLKAHVSAWRLLPRKQFSKRWGLRLKPKVSLFTELRLQGSGVNPTSLTRKRDRGDLEAGENANQEKHELEADNSSVACDLVLADDPKPDGLRKCRSKKRKLLQFDKSHRPAYYGTYSKGSDTVMARRPLKKDTSLDYEVDSDEEWEEEDPGESLSDCEKDEEDEKVEAEDDDENSDGFMVPDGYLSESEGVHLEDTDSEDTGESPSSTRRKSIHDDTNCSLAEDDIDVQAFERLRKVLDNATDHAVRSNRPFVINMLRRDSNDQQDLTKTQRVCLQALRIIAVSPKVLIEPPEDSVAATRVQPQETTRRGRKKRVFALSDSSLKEFVQVLMSSSNGIKKTRELLIEKFPQAPKAFLNAKIHEMAEYVDNRWQVKSEVLEQQGLVASEL